MSINLFASTNIKLQQRKLTLQNNINITALNDSNKQTEGHGIINYNPHLLQQDLQDKIINILHIKDKNESK